MRPAFLVSHPTRQYSHELATALHRASQLSQYWTGIPAHARSILALPYSPLRSRIKYSELSLPADLVRHCYLSSVTGRVANATMSEGAAATAAHVGDALFDKWAALRLRRYADPRLAAIVCYENAALKTFREAYHRGFLRILDAASVHFTEQARVSTYPGSTRALKQIEGRKRREIELADHILTASTHARDTYVRAGVEPDKVTAVTLGVDVTLFGTRRPMASGSRGGVLHFVFAGTASNRKGLDTLLAAARVLYDRDISFRLTIAGSLAPRVVLPHAPYLEHAGRLRQQELAKLFHRADVLVHPSRHESFGMVIVEALAAGLPAIVSDQVGAKEAIREGENGWIIPASDVRALAARMQACAMNVSSVENMRPAARISAEPYSWQNYHARVSEVLNAVVRRQLRVSSRS